MNLYDATIPVFTKFLGNAERWIAKARAHAEHKKFDPEVLFGARLAPDQYPFAGQLQTACDAAKYCAAKLCGKQPPSHPDTEKTLDELVARIRAVQAYLQTFTRDDFLGSEDRTVQHEWMRGKSVKGGDYLDHVALPNFHFHYTTAYNILRHNGVDLGIMDVLGDIPFIA
jgi:hypothetical protein